MNPVPTSNTTKYGHAITAIPFSGCTYNGKKAFVIVDS